jgi:hypothetical protein
MIPIGSDDDILKRMSDAQRCSGIGGFGLGQGQEPTDFGSAEHPKSPDFRAVDPRLATRELKAG